MVRWRSYLSCFLLSNVKNTRHVHAFFSLPLRMRGTMKTNLEAGPVFLEGLAEANHSTFLLDMWGVMHDGSSPYEGAIETVSLLKARGKRMVVLSNSSKRRANAAAALSKLGFDPSDFEDVVTSGEVSHGMMSGDPSLEAWPPLADLLREERRKVFVLGSGDGDEEYCASANWTLAPPEEADLILARGTFAVNDGQRVVCKTRDPEEYQTQLEKSLRVAAKRRIPMLVSNPDRVRPSEGFPPMPGAIGDSYERLLGDGSLVKRVGKPFPEVYRLALKGQPPGEAIMVGDSLETDVRGGVDFGCHTLWIIKDGVHAKAVNEAGEGNLRKGVDKVLEDFNRRNRSFLSPAFVAPHFKW